MFSLNDKIIALTGGAGALASAISVGLSRMGATVVPLVREVEQADGLLGSLVGSRHRAFRCDVLDEQQVAQALDQIFDTYGRLDVLINAAGGNQAGATIGPEQAFYELDATALDRVIRLNVQGTMIPSSAAVKRFQKQGHGNIINFSSMAAQLPLTRVVGYSAAKAAIDNFTKWLAVELATKYGDQFRVNAIAPGFFLGKQNRKLLLQDDGQLTARGATIINQTPMQRFGQADELIGTIVWLCSDASKFVTGTIIPVDGGFSAFSGV